MELNAVLLKACAPDPRQRYESAEEMNADLALLYSGKSVQQKQMLERRLKIATRVGIGLAAILVLGAFPYYLAITQAHRASVLAGQELIARKKAQAAAGKAEQTAGFLRQMLESVEPSIANGRNTELLKEILDNASERVGKELKDQPEAEAEMCGIIGKVYNELGLYDRAEPMLSRANDLQKGIAGVEGERAETLDRLAFSCLKQDKINDAEKYLAESLVLQRKIHGPNSLEVAVSLNNLAMLLHRQGHLSEAEEKQREALKIERGLFGDNHPEVATSLSGLAVILCDEGHFEEAESNSLQAVEICSKLSTNETWKLAAELDVLAGIFSAENKLHKAVETHRRVVDLRRKLLGPDHPDLADSLQNLGNTLFVQRDFGGAEKAYEESRAIRERRPGPESSDYSSSLKCIAAIKAETDLLEAEKLYRQALAIDTKVWGSNSLNVAGTSVRLARVIGERGALDEAESRASSALQVFRKVYATAPAHPDILFAMDTLAATMRRSGKLPDAEKLFRESLTNRVSRLGEEDPEVYDSRERLARTLRATAKLDEAESLLQRCLAFRETNSPGAWVVFNTQAGLGGVLADRRQYDKAEELLLSAFQGLTNSQHEIPANNRDCVKDTNKELVKLYRAIGKPEEAAAWEALLK
jgi:serine/threonine-protein kinase